MIIRRWDRHPKRRDAAELVEMAREAAKIDALRERLRGPRTTVDLNDLMFFLTAWGLDPLHVDVPALAQALLETYTVQRKVKAL